MLLVFDVGNTDIVAGFYEQGKLVETYRTHMNKQRTKDEYISVFDAMFAAKNISIGKQEKKAIHIDGICISSVVPEVQAMLVLLCRKYWHIPYFFVSAESVNLRIIADQPQEVGADLITAAYGVNQVYGGNCIVIDCGTATTLSYINREGIFAGVVIMPGIKSSLAALIGSTSLLPNITLDTPKKVLGNNSLHCMQSGIMIGHMCMLEGLIARVIAQEQLQDCKLIATGGYSGMLLRHTDLPFIHDPHLLLDGLARIYRDHVE